MKKKAGGKSDTQLVCTYRKALQRFEIEERMEAGLVLRGSEVKSLRERHADLEGSYAAMEGGELYLHKMHIGPYEKASAFGHESKSSRKLLMHRHELQRLQGKLSLRGFTLIPLQIYFKGGYAKVELGLATAKKMADRRESLKREQALREAKAAMQRARGRG